MQWIRKYGGWILVLLFVLSVVSRWYYRDQKWKVLDKQADEQVARAKEDYQRNLAKKHFWSNWTKAESGEEKDTLYIPYYDSLLDVCPDVSIAGDIRRHLTGLKTLSEKPKAERLLPGKWKLAWRDYSFSGMKKSKAPEFFVFHPDHTFEYYTGQKKICSDSFSIAADVNFLALQLFPLPASVDLYSASDFDVHDLENDTLAFYRAGFVTEKYARVKN